MTRLVNIYRSSLTQEMYLYVDSGEDLTRVPEALLARFGRPVLAMSIMLDAGRQLARADAGTVLNQIDVSGYYLQMPPAPEGWRAL